MLNLFFRKNFYDGWDNLIFILIPNAVLDAIIVAAGLLCIPGFTVFKESSWYLFVWFALFVITVVLCCIFTLSWAEVSYNLVDYGAPELKDFFSGFKGCVKDGILYGLTLCFFALVSVTGIIYFLKPQEGGVTFTGLAAGAVWVWVTLTILMSILWYPAIRAVMHNSYGKAIKKCFILFFDNIGKCLILSIYNLFLVFISIVMLGIAPGMAGIQIARTNFLRLLMKKYDYLEELDKKGEPQNSAARRKIPWKELLADDIEANPARTAKEFFFPWKTDNGSGKPDPEKSESED